MAKFIDKEVLVKHDDKYTPLAFFYSTRWLPVDHVLEIWKDTGTWWDGESEKIFYRIAAGSGSMYELYRDTGSHIWFLYRIYD